MNIKKLCYLCFRWYRNRMPCNKQIKSRKNTSRTNEHPKYWISFLRIEIQFELREPTLCRTLWCYKVLKGWWRKLNGLHTISIESSIKFMSDFLVEFRRELSRLRRRGHKLHFKLQQSVPLTPPLTPYATRLQIQSKKRRTEIFQKLLAFYRQWNKISRFAKEKYTQTQINMPTSKFRGPLIYFEVKQLLDCTL